MTSKLPPISIGIPFYNAESTLLDAVRSVFAQTHQDWELILIDDGSKDRSLEIAQSIKDPRVHVYSDGNNKRLAARLNQINKLSSFDYIARMDADDLMSPNRIEKLLGFLVNNSELDLVSCGMYSIANDNSLRGVRGNYCAKYTFKGLLTKQQRFLHAGLVVRKEWYARNQYDESLTVGQDTELWLRSAKKNDFKAASLKEPLYMYREEGNVTLRKLHRAYKLERKKIAPLIDSTSERSFYITKSYAKTTAAYAMAKTNTLGYLLQRRNSAIVSDKVKADYAGILNDIYNVKIHGVDI